MILRIATLIALAATLVAAAGKNRDWQSGTLLDTEHNAYFGGGHGTEVTTLAFGDVMTGSEFHFTTLPTASNYSIDHYVIESETDVYLVERMRVRSSKPPTLVINRPVQFAIFKNKLWLIDADSQELQTRVVKQKAKLNPPNRLERYLPPSSDLISMAFRDACCCTLLAIADDSSKNFKPSRI